MNIALVAILGCISASMLYALLTGLLYGLLLVTCATTIYTDKMRCLEWGPDVTVNGSRVTFHKPGTYRIEPRFEYKADDSSGKGI